MSCCRKRMYDIYTEKENKECSCEDKKKERKNNIEYLILIGICAAVVIISLLLK